MIRAGARMAPVIRQPLAAGPEARGLPAIVRRAGLFPRLRYMGSKYRLIPHLARAFTELGGVTALDAFSGSGVVSYLLKTCGYQVTANDFLAFPAVIARASVVNQDVTLSADDIARICGPPADDRDFIRRTFAGIYFTEADLGFLDSAWSCPRPAASPAASSPSPACVTTTGAVTCAFRSAITSPSVPPSTTRWCSTAVSPAPPPHPTCLTWPRRAMTWSIWIRPTRRPATTTVTSSGTTSWKGCRCTGAIRRRWRARRPGSCPSATRRSPTP